MNTIRKTAPFAPRHLLAELAIVASYVMITLAMTWPLILHLSTHFAGQNIDVWINQWATWWTEEALSQGRNLYYTDLMFYPHGVSLAFHSFSHVNTLLVILMRPLLGDLGAHNAAVILAHALSGYAMFCLVRYLARSTLAAFLAGLVFAFFPYRMAESVHPVLVSTQWMPLYLLYLIRLVEEKRKRYALAAALFFVLTALTSWHLMILTLFVSAIYLGYIIVAERQRCLKATLLNLALLSGLAGIVTAPFLYPLIREQFAVPHSYVGVDQETGKGNDLAAFLLPAEQHPVLGRYVIWAHARIKNIRAAFLGFTVILLSIMGSLKNWKQARFWTLTALLSMLASVDSPVQVGGWSLGVTMPWSVPVIWLLRHPFRFNLLVGLALAVLSGLGLSVVLRRLANRQLAWRWPLASLIAALLLFEYLYLPFPLTPAVTPSYYSELAASPSEGAILELPMGREPARYYLYYQMTHGKPLVEGIVSRTPEQAYALIQARPALRSLRQCGSDALPPATLSPILNSLREDGIEYVILHKRLVKKSALDLWLETRATPPDYEDEEIAVYATRTISPPAAGAAQLLESCIAVRPLLSDPITVPQGQALEIPLEWIVGNSTQADYVLELALSDEAGTVRRRHYYEIVPGAPLSSWQTGKRLATVYSFQVDRLIPPGLYDVRASLIPTNREGDTWLSVPVLQVQVTGESTSSSPPATYTRVANVDYGTELRLEGYDLEAGCDMIHMTLRWQPLRQIEADYKFFVHLYDTQNGALAAQTDTMPQDWTYPTRGWTPGRTISDEITLSLEGVPPGTYRLGIGVYDLTGRRLAISGHLPPFVADEDRLFLPEEIGP